MICDALDICNKYANISQNHSLEIYFFQFLWQHDIVQKSYLASDMFLSLPHPTPKLLQQILQHFTTSYLLGIIQNHLKVLSGEHLLSEIASAVNCLELLILLQAIIYKVNSSTNREDSSFSHASFTFQELKYTITTEFSFRTLMI